MFFSFHQFHKVSSQDACYNGLLKGADKMRKFSKKMLVIVVTFFVIFLLLMGGYYFYQQYFISQPLSLTLDNSKLIDEYTIEENQEQLVICLDLNKTETLSDDFYQLLKKGSQLKKENLIIQIQSKPNENLLTVYQQLNPTIYEVLELGNYAFLQDRLKEFEKEKNLNKAEITVTDEFIFIILEDEEAYLYSIFNKGENSIPKIKNKMGSGSNET